jgi:hypothetical protein
MNNWREIALRTELQGRRLRVVTDATSTIVGKEKNFGIPVGYAG